MPACAIGPAAETSPSAWQRLSGQYEVLVRHFFSRFVETGGTANIGSVIGIVATPGALLGILLQPLSVLGWGLVQFRYYCVAYSMIVVALLVVYRWDLLFPDRADYQILTPLPIRSSTLFFSRLLAFGMLLAGVLVAANALATAMWPGIDPRGSSLHCLATHALVTSAAGLFAGFSAAAVPGLLLNALPAGVFRRVSPVAQTLAIALLILLLFLTPVLSVVIKQVSSPGNPWLERHPAYWFVGLYEQLRPATSNPRLADAGHIAVQGLAVACAAFMLLYVPSHARHARKLLECPAPSGSGPSRLRRAWTTGLQRKALKDPLDRALFHFIAATVARSMKHRLFLAGYGGFGAALVVSSLASGPDGLAALPFLLSFVFVSAARALFQIPSELPANWAFRITEDHTTDRYLPAMRKWIVACALVPLFAFLAVVQFALLPSALAAFRLLFQFITALLLTELLFFRFRSVAFTCAHLPGKSNLVGLCTLYFVGLSVFGRGMAAVQSLAGSSLDSQAVCLGFTLLVLGTVRRVCDSDADTAEEKPDFNGDLEVEIRTINLLAE